MFGYIYKTTNMKNNKIYVGKKHKSFFVDDYFGSGVLINKAINKYGENNFKVELIDSAESLEELNEKEIYWIKELKSQVIYGNYNIAEGGFGGDIFSYLPEDMKEAFIQKCKENSKGKNNPNYGNGYKIQVDKNPSKRPEVRQKIKLASSGKNNAMYGIKKELHPMYNKKHTEESINKMKETLSKTVYSLECNQCFSSFTSPNANTKYCCDECKIEYRKIHYPHLFPKKENKNGKSYKKICVNCNKDFLSGGATAKYCSDVCKRRYRGN